MRQRVAIGGISVLLLVLLLENPRTSSLQTRGRDGNRDPEELRGGTPESGASVRIVERSTPGSDAFVVRIAAYVAAASSPTSSDGGSNCGSIGLDLLGPLALIWCWRRRKSVRRL